MPLISALSLSRVNARLSIDFGHSPVSSLWDRASGETPLERLSPAQQRARTGRLLHAMHVLSPGWVFADSKRRAALECTSLAVSNLIGALSERPVDEAAVGVILQGLPDMMQPLVVENVTALTVFEARLEFHLQSMSSKQLLAFRDGIASSSAGDQHTQAAKRIIDAMIQPLAAEGAPFVMSGVWSGEQHSSDLTKIASQLHARYGQDSQDPQKQLLLVADTLAELTYLDLGKGGIDALSPRQLQARSAHLNDLLEGLPISELRALVACEPNRIGASPRTGAGYAERAFVRKVATACLTQRYGETIQEFNEALTAIDEIKKCEHKFGLNPRTQAVSAFAKSVVQATNMLLSLQTDSATLARPPVVNEARRALLKTKVGKLGGGDGGFIVTHLDGAVLEGFQRALTALGLTDQASSVGREIEKRKQREFATLATNAVDTWREGDFARAKELFAKSGDLAADIFAARQRSGLPQENGSKDDFGLQLHLMKAVVDHVPAELKALCLSHIEEAAGPRLARVQNELPPRLVL